MLNFTRVVMEGGGAGQYKQRKEGSRPIIDLLIPGT